MTAAAMLAVLGALAPAGSSATRAGACPNYCGAPGGPELIAVAQLPAARVRVEMVLARGGPLQLVVERSVGGRLVRARPAVLAGPPRETLTGRVPVGGRSEAVADIALRSRPAGLRSATVSLSGGPRPLAPGVYVLSLNAVGRDGAVLRRGTSILVRIMRGGRVSYLLVPHVAPYAATGAASAVGQLSARVSGSVDPYGQVTSYYFQYGLTPAYGAQSASQPAGAGGRRASVSANLTGLSFASTYHYRLVATACSGCAWGTTYGADRTFVTLAETGLPEQQIDADRAVAAYNAMQGSFYATDGSSLYAETYPQSGNRYSFLWPFSRALAGTLTLAGVPSNLLGGASYQSDAGDRLTGLSHYWDGTGYDSYPPAPYGKGGDKYYDDAAWVGVATAQYNRKSGDPTALAEAQNAFNWVYPGGWDTNSSDPDPGGIYWVNQGVGVGATNHDRTTTSNAPNAELALLLGNVSAANQIYGWVNQYLYNLPTSPNYASNQPPLMFDHVTAAGTIDHTLWTYNQGTMIAANVREYQLTGQAAYLSEAEAIANTALDTFTESTYIAQPAAFDAIFFRGLLVLYAATGDTALQSRIIQTIQAYADDAWNNHRSSQNLFKFPSSPGSGYQLLDQGAMVQIYAALAWNPTDYDKLP
jgi:hypothetical protein